MNKDNKGIQAVYSYGFIDLEGAKLSAIILDYGCVIDAGSLQIDTYEIENFTLHSIAEKGYEETIELDGDGIPGNEGTITGVYVSDRKEPSEKCGLTQGRYVVIEVNTDYMLSTSNLVYTTSMMAGVRQTKDIQSDTGIIPASNAFVRNYTETPGTPRHPWDAKSIIQTEKEKILLPELNEEAGWKMHYIGKNAFHASNCYSEYTGEYYDFELPYALYVPKKEIMEQHKGHISLAIHMEHAGAFDSDPMSGVTCSRAAVLHASDLVQKDNPAIIVVPQVEESRRSTNDQYLTSEVNTAVWELLDWLLETYRGYIDENRIYGTGQSMGGMLLLNMSMQRDHFFAGLAIIGSQWGNNYNKERNNQGKSGRTPENDPISFGSQEPNEHYENFYYMISDKNILVHTCVDDVMATGLWHYVKEYFEANGVNIPTAMINPYAPIDEQNAADTELLNHDTSTPGSGITWGLFDRGSHMSTWKYGYHITTPYIWLYKQNRTSAVNRGKVESLTRTWLGRNPDGTIAEGSGTENLNTQQFQMFGPDDAFPEGSKEAK